jgi:hypothetical protein
MPNGHIRIDLITDITKNTVAEPGKTNLERFAALNANQRKLFTERFKEVITPGVQGVADYAELMTRPWFDAKVKADYGALPSNAEVKKWFTLAIDQYKAEVTGAAPITLLAGPPACVRIVIIDGIPKMVFNQGLTLAAEAVPIEFRDRAAPPANVIYGSFHIMLTYTGPDRDRDAIIEPDPLPAGPND